MDKLYSSLEALSLALKDAKEAIDDLIKCSELDAEEVCLVEHNQHLQAIKHVRSRLGLGLIDAKAMVDDFIASSEFTYLQMDDVIKHGDDILLCAGEWSYAHDSIGRKLREVSFTAARRRK